MKKRKPLSPQMRKLVWQGTPERDDGRVRPIHRPYKGLVEEQDLLARTGLEAAIDGHLRGKDEPVRDLTGRVVKP